MHQMCWKLHRMHSLLFNICQKHGMKHFLADPPMNHLNDSFRQWLSEDFQKLWRVLSAARSEPVHHRVRQTPQQSTHNFHRQQHQHRQPVETVMDCSSSECPAVSWRCFIIFFETRKSQPAPRSCCTFRTLLSRRPALERRWYWWLTCRCWSPWWWGWPTEHSTLQRGDLTGLWKWILMNVAAQEICYGGITDWLTFSEGCCETYDQRTQGWLWWR